MSSTPELPGPLPWEIGGGRFDEWIEDANGAYIALDVALAYLNAAPAREAQARADALEEAAKFIEGHKMAANSEWFATALRALPTTAPEKQGGSDV